MKIGIICPYSLTLPGGVQMQVLGLARSLRRMGHDVRVLGPCDGPPPDTGVTPLGASVPTAANGSIAPIAPDVPAQLRTIRALRDEEFDVLHLHEPLAPGPTQTALLVKNAPIVGTFHAAGDSASYKYLKVGVRWLAKRMAHRCAVSADAEDLASRYLGGSYTRVFNGIDVDQHAAASPWPKDGPTVFFIGRHEPRKGLDVLLAAFRSLPADARLWVGSDGPDTADLKKRHGDDDRISWLGRISDHEKLSRIRGADVLCAPALRGESFGIVLLEGMAAGTPVVATDIDGYRNVASDGRDARLVPPGDVDALAKALGEVLAGGPEVDRLVDAGQARADEFSMQHLAERYEAIYESVL